MTTITTEQPDLCTWCGHEKKAYSRELLIPMQYDDLRRVLSTVYGKEAVSVAEIISSLSGLTVRDAALIRAHFAFHDEPILLDELAAFFWRRSNVYEDDL